MMKKNILLASSLLFLYFFSIASETPKCLTIISDCKDVISLSYYPVISQVTKREEYISSLRIPVGKNILNTEYPLLKSQINISCYIEGKKQETQFFVRDGCPLYIEQKDSCIYFKQDNYVLKKIALKKMSSSSDECIQQ